MSRFRNDNEHRIYYEDENGARRYARAGTIFEAPSSVGSRPGVSSVSTDDAKAADATAAGEDVVTSSEADRAQGVADLSGLAALAGTAPLRDEITDEGHRVPGSGLGRNPNAPSSPPAGTPPAHDPAVAGQPESVPGTRDTSAPTVAADFSDRVADAGEAASAEESVGEVVFASDSAEDKADELGVRDQLTPGEGGGQDGAYRVRDVENAAKA